MTSSATASRLLAPHFFWRLKTQTQCVQSTVKLGSQERVDSAVSGDVGLALEGGRYHFDKKVCVKYCHTYESRHFRRPELP